LSSSGEDEEIDPLKVPPIISKELREMLKSEAPEFRRYFYLLEGFLKHLRDKRDVEGARLFLELNEALFGYINTLLRTYLGASAGKRRGT